jgi:adenosylmethionine-8-amino-7-oxononanoate aminotransferase
MVGESVWSRQPRINAALKDQLDQLEHAMLAGFTHTPVMNYQKISRIDQPPTRSLLLRLRWRIGGRNCAEDEFHSWRNRGQTDKQEFICIQGSYHGETVGALAVTDVSLFREAYGPMLQRAHVVASPDARLAQEGESAADVALRAAADLERVLQQREGKIAAVIIEPLVQCATGMAMHDPVYLRRLRELCDQYQVHLIADEIAVGCGRTGTFFACESAQIWPDFYVVERHQRRLSAPEPGNDDRCGLSVVLRCRCTARLLHSHSYTGNPLACRAALATLAIFAEDDVLAQNRRKAQMFADAFAPLRDDPRVRHVRQQGMIFAFDAIVDDAEKPRHFRAVFSAPPCSRNY